MCTTMALLLFFFTFTTFSSLGLGRAGVGAVKGAVPEAPAELDDEEDEEDAEDLLKRLLKKLPLPPDRPRTKKRNVK